MKGRPTHFLKDVLFEACNFVRNMSIWKRRWAKLGNCCEPRTTLYGHIFFYDSQLNTETHYRNGCCCVCCDHLAIRIQELDWFCGDEWRGRIEDKGTWPTVRIFFLSFALTKPCICLFWLFASYVQYTSSSLFALSFCKSDTPDMSCPVIFSLPACVCMVCITVPCFYFVRVFFPVSCLPACLLLEKIQNPNVLGRRWPLAATNHPGRTGVLLQYPDRRFLLDHSNTILWARSGDPIRTGYARQSPSIVIFDSSE